MNGETSPPLRRRSSSFNGDNCGIFGATWNLEGCSLDWKKELKNYVPANVDMVIVTLQNHVSDIHDHLGLGSWIFSPQMGLGSGNEKSKMKSALDLKRGDTQVSVLHKADSVLRGDKRTLCKEGENSLHVHYIAGGTNGDLYYRIQLYEGSRYRYGGEIGDYTALSLIPGHDLDCPCNDIRNGWCAHNHIRPFRVWIIQWH